jgi:RNA polymerase sigma-70 factor (ECF subfamily)
MIVYLSMIDTPEGKSKFERLYLEYRGLMYHVAYQILQNHQDAEDAVHQAFLKIAEKIETVDGTICPRTQGYLVTIAESRAIDLYRRRSRLRTEPLDEDNMGIPIVYDGENVLTACLAKLPARQREVLLLKHYHGLSSKEVAHKLGLTEANVIKIDQRAKQALRTMCREEEIL